MTEEEKEKYLRVNGWIKLAENLWTHITCNYNCHTSIAIDVQKLRNDKAAK